MSAKRVHVRGCDELQPWHGVEAMVIVNWYAYILDIFQVNDELRLVSVCYALLFRLDGEEAGELM